MKRLIGMLLDFLFFLSFIGVALLTALYLIYSQEKDISVLNVYLQTDLTRTLLYVYIGWVALYLIYFWILPSILKQTIGQRLAGTSFASEKKITWWRVFLKTIVGRFWDTLLFPYTLFAVIKKKTLISTKLSGIIISKIEQKPTKGHYFATLVYSIFLIITVGVGTYIYKAGITPTLEKYTNYEKQVNNLMDMLAYQDASAVLEKYKSQKGEDQNYWYYLCLIDANLSTELSSLDVCTKAATQNATNTERQRAILSQEAKVYAANDDFKKAEELYAKLWNEFQDRTLDMKNYVVVLSEQGKSKDATTILNEVAKQVPQDDPITLRDLGNLYERIGAIDTAFDTYQKALSTIKEGENMSLAGELYYDIGVVYYNKAKYTDATTSFEKAKELNKDYAEPVDSYIILINKLKNSVTK